MAEIIDGKKIAQEILCDLKQSIRQMPEKPGLAILLIGDDEASHVYVKLKKKAGEECDIGIYLYLFPTDVEEKNIMAMIDFLNHDPEIDGIIVQLPLPHGFDEDTIIRAIDPAKDVDGFHPQNLEALTHKKPRIISGLALGIVRLIHATNVDLAGKNAIIISNHSVFAEPIRYLLELEGVKVNALKSSAKNLKKATQTADILIVAVGKKYFVKKSWVKNGSIIIDVGINRLRNKKIVGDVDDTAGEKAAFITPVPGGVGPMTVAMLLYNTYTLALTKRSKQ